MRQISKAPAALALGLALIAAPPVQANDPDPGSPRDKAVEGIELLVQALEQLIQSIPQYEPPVVLDNGDILIRRKWPPGQAPDEPESDETRA